MLIYVGFVELEPIYSLLVFLDLLQTASEALIMQKLKRYAAKRDFSKTAEPGPGKKSSKAQRPLIFVVQKHAASHLHYDFRLESDGVLVSWAVPKGPSNDTSQKRLAVHVEDHPLDYADFEGHIPEGQYGGGDVIVWDNGTFTLDDLPDGSRAEVDKAFKAGLKKGKLAFTLKGKKLKGSWALVKFGKSPKNWLLIKHKDEYADLAKDRDPESDLLADDKSVISRRRLKDPETDEKIEKIKVKTKTKTKSNLTKKTSVESKDFAPMLATLGDQPFDAKGSEKWTFEPKLDGIRVIACKFGKEVVLLSRNGIDITAKFPEIVEVLAGQRDNLVVDGEIVAIDENGRPNFEVLQAGSLDLRYVLFDILQSGAIDATNMPLVERRKLLKNTVKAKGPVELIKPYKCSGIEAFAEAMKEGLEGVVAKTLDGRYRPGQRAKDWIKWKGHKSDEFIVCGYTRGTGARSAHFGALLVARKSGKTLQFAGKVGTGFNATNMKALLALFKPLIRKSAPIDLPESVKEPVTWLTPQIVVEVKYAEATSKGMLRAPVFMRVREDIDSTSVGSKKTIANKSVKSSKSIKTIKPIKHEHQDLIDQIGAMSKQGSIKVQGHEIKLTNLDKVFWPKTKDHPAYTKRDYLIYLVKIWPFIQPHLKDRPFTLIRRPDGIEGQSFFQKHKGKGAPDFIDTVKMFSEHGDDDGDFMLCNSLATLLWFGQMGALELHATHTRIANDKTGPRLSLDCTGSVEKIQKCAANFPDFMVIDLDPYLYSGKEKAKEEPQLHEKGFRAAATCALWLKDLLDEMGLIAYVKTSGKTGLHIYIPIERRVAYDQVRKWVETIGRHMMDSLPDLITMDWAIKKRTGKVFFDHNMNARGKTLPVPYSLRASIDATVSLPIAWDELRDKNLYPTQFTMMSIWERLAKKGDLWADILQHRNKIDPKKMGDV